ncbi:hypothetical protein P1A145kb_p235 [Pectobacterium phage DU_PP_I]|nr:hypothetical protein P1A145kb_p235 [Pectobacterium phage DU_PP_I]ATS93952.1 hypothetical protein P12B145kb_p236 [Pectobacterium phage DU_PP_IV]
MLIKFNREQIAALLKNQSVQSGIDKESRDIKLPEMNTTASVLEHIGAKILSKLENCQ